MRENDNYYPAKMKPEIVSFNARINIFIVELICLGLMAIGLSHLFQLININSWEFLFFPFPFIGIFIFPLLFQGRTLLMILYGIKIENVKTNKPVSLKILILRQIYRILYILPLFTIFWSLITNKRSPWYDRKLDIQMVWPERKEFNREDWIKKDNTKRSIPEILQKKDRNLY